MQTIEEYLDEHQLMQADITRACNISRQTLSNRYRKGWYIEERPECFLFINPKQKNITYKEFKSGRSIEQL